MYLLYKTQKTKEVIRFDRDEDFKRKKTMNPK